MDALPSQCFPRMLMRNDCCVNLVAQKVTEDHENRLTLHQKVCRHQLRTPLLAAALLLQDAAGNFDDCSLTLRPAVVWRRALLCCLKSLRHSNKVWEVPVRAGSSRALPSLRPVIFPPQDPVITPEGYVFSREAILEYFLSQKKVQKKKVAAWEAQQQEEATKVSRKSGLYRPSCSAAAASAASSGSTAPTAAATAAAAAATTNACGCRHQEAEKEAIAAEARLIAFDRKNHMGVSDASAKNLVEAIEQEVEAMQDTKKVPRPLPMWDRQNLELPRAVVALSVFERARAVSLNRRGFGRLRGKGGEGGGVRGEEGEGGRGVIWSSGGSRVTPPCHRLCLPISAAVPPGRQIIREHRVQCGAPQGDEGLLAAVKDARVAEEAGEALF